MKPLLLIMLLFVYSGVLSQGINQDINTITIKGVTIRQVQDRLLKSGFSIGKLDYKSKTVQTTFVNFDTKNGLLNLSIKVHLHDSVAIITGAVCYNLKNLRYGIPDSTRCWDAKYTFGPDKQAFLQMDKFAKSFNSEIIYSKTN